MAGNGGKNTLRPEGPLVMLFVLVLAARGA